MKGIKMNNINMDDKLKELLARDQAEAIRENCKGCKSYMNLNEKKDCTITSCPLYKFRDGDGLDDWKESGKAIHDYCCICGDDSVYIVCSCNMKDCPLWVNRMNDLNCFADSVEKLMKQHKLCVRRSFTISRMKFGPEFNSS
jgi:hypothetical protein